MMYLNKFLINSKKKTKILKTITKIKFKVFKLKNKKRKKKIQPKLFKYH